MSDLTPEELSAMAFDPAVTRGLYTGTAMADELARLRCLAKAGERLYRALVWHDTHDQFEFQFRDNFNRLLDDYEKRTGIEG